MDLTTSHSKELKHNEIQGQMEKPRLVPCSVPVNGISLTLWRRKSHCARYSTVWITALQSARMAQSRGDPRDADGAAASLIKEG